MAAGRGFGSRIIEAALESEAERIAQAARGYAPVDTGALRDSIVSRMEDGVAVVSASVPYAASVELGSFARAPRPFLSPAYLENRQRVVDSVAAAAREELEDLL